MAPQKAEASAAAVPSHADPYCGSDVIAAPPQRDRDARR